MSKCEEGNKTGCNETIFKIRIPEGTEFEFMDCIKIKIPGGIDYKVKFPLCHIPSAGIPGFDPAVLMDMYRSPDMAKYLDMLKKAGIDVEITK